MEARELLQNYYGRNTVSLFKGFLVLIEDLQKEHSIHFAKLKKNLPDEYTPIIEQADYLDEDKLQYLRKRILDLGNETVRKVDSEMEEFTISFKFNN
jgi:hypothetical protein